MLTKQQKEKIYYNCISCKNKSHYYDTTFYTIFLSNTAYKCNMICYKCYFKYIVLAIK